VMWLNNCTLFALCGLSLKAVLLVFSSSQLVRHSWNGSSCCRTVLFAVMMAFTWPLVLSPAAFQSMYHSACRYFCQECQMFIELENKQLVCLFLFENSPTYLLAFSNNNNNM